MDIYLYTLAANLPEKVYLPLIYQAEFILPRGKYQKRDFKRCIFAYACMLTKHYKIKPTKEFRYFLGQFIRYLGELFEAYTVTCLAEVIRSIAATISSVPTDIYEGKKEKPPPNFLKLALCSLAPPIH